LIVVKFQAGMGTSLHVFLHCSCNLTIVFGYISCNNEPTILMIDLSTNDPMAIRPQFLQVAECTQIMAIISLIGGAFLAIFVPIIGIPWGLSERTLFWKKRVRLKTLTFMALGVGICVLCSVAVIADGLLGPKIGSTLAQSATLP
jgi:hypothetical protein